MNKNKKMIVALIGGAAVVCVIGALFFLTPSAQNIFDPLFVIILLIFVYCIFAAYMYWLTRFYEEGTEYTQKKKK